MSASSSLFMAVALAYLAMSVNTLKCWSGISRDWKNEEQCEPGTVFCLQAHCLFKVDGYELINMECRPNVSLCDDVDYEDKSYKCTRRCCRNDLCNVMPDLVPGPPAVVISGPCWLEKSLYHDSLNRICQVVLMELKNEEKVEWKERTTTTNYFVELTVDT
ncbi:hypothetical protein niasHS_009777 [Heterodera schachtii]|uniref:Uncharacterized protein n=1 Tax=Heterodera schachtii TaxID=97005 RepID=A0ABD2IWI9_HETSC